MLVNHLHFLINAAAGLICSLGFALGALGVIEQAFALWDGSTSRLNLQEENL